MRKRLLPLLLLPLLLIWLGLPLLAMAVRADGLRHDYTDADQLFRVAPLAAMTGVVKVKDNGENAEYLLRGRIFGPPSLFTGTAGGWHLDW